MRSLFGGLEIMIWNKYTIKTTTKDAEVVSALLMDYGINDVEIENNVQLTDEELNQMYADFVKELPEDDGTCFINFFMKFDENESPEERKTKIDQVWAGLKEDRERFGLDPMEFSEETVNSEDWENKWKEYFKPFRVDDILIKPTWEELPENEDYKVVIEIDPGMAFGTGMHETTRLCLRGICKYMKEGDVITDLGCGSGILSIGALKLGASFASAVDIDPQATAVAVENFASNNIDDRTFMVQTGNVLTDDNMKEMFAVRPADIVLANILADVIEPLCGEVQDYMKSGAYFISSGIIDTKEQLIVDAVNANPELELVEVVSGGDWRSVVARRK